MKAYVVALALSLSVSACVGAPTPGGVSPTTTVTPSASPSSAATVVLTSTPTASARPVTYRLMPSVPGRATVSPDGRWIAALKRQAGASIFESIQLYTIDGTPTREFPDTGVFWGWLPDSSALFVATMLPQRAPPLGIIELDGRVVATELQLSHEMLSRDGKLIVADYQEGCCVSIVQREIRVARRDGSAVRTLVTSQVPSEPHTVALLGIDASDRAVYRDGTKIMRIPLAGGATTTIATSNEYARVTSGDASPDGAAILARGYDPTRWYVIANDRVTAWDEAIGSVVQNGSSEVARKGKGDAALWVGPHTFLARDAAGALLSVDAVTSTRVPHGARLASGDVVLAHQRGTLLVVRGGVVVVIDITSGTVRETGLDLRPNSEGAQATALPSGAFVLSSSAGTYRID